MRVSARTELLSIMSRFLSHYWLATEPQAVRNAQLEDWLEDVEEFGVASVANACRTWRRRPDNRRPTPGEIRALCLAERDAAQTRTAATPIDMDEYARDVGFASNAERMEAIARDKLRYSSAANEERLRQIERELTARPVREQPGAAAVTLGVTATEVLRKARIALGLEPEPEPEPEPETLAEAAE